MKRVESINQKNDDDEDDEDDEESRVNWANLIFLPFHPAFKLAILIVVVIKTIMGPFDAAFLTNCLDPKKIDSDVLSLLRKVYIYICDPFYATDFILHILHRQVTDEAVKREFLPKSSVCLVLDLLALIPLYRLVLNDMDTCQNIIWPNILLFLEFLPVYRIVEYFSLISTSCAWKLIIGFFILSSVSLNFLTCLLILLTRNRFVAQSHYGIYDWRKNDYVNVTHSDTHLCVYTHAATFVLSFFVNSLNAISVPILIFEYVIASCIMVLGYIIITFIIFPKLFADSILRIKKICEYVPQVKLLISEALLRNPKMGEKKEIQKFYSIIWNKRNGISQIPNIFLELPRYLIINIKMDLLWPIFYHSPCLRETSNQFKRWLCTQVHFEYKLPHSDFFTSLTADFNFYYIKSGIVQLMSSDDGATPILSLTSGTVIGDISFFAPHLIRNTKVVCLTYCEVYYICRCDILKAMNAFSEDKKHLLRCAQYRLKHARTLYLCKQHIRGLDRTEDEGIAWVKKRWWEIMISMKRNNKGNLKHSLPDEDAVYHCAKYIGLLVLCNDIQRKTKSLFSNVKFPFTLQPHSTFAKIWSKVLLVTIYMVLIFYPPAITLSNRPFYFTILQIWVDLIYSADIVVSLITTIEKQEENMQHFEELLLYHSKKIYFILDVLAALWLETFILFLGHQNFYYICLSNRLLKIYYLFKDRFITKHNITRNPLYVIVYKTFLIGFCFLYITCFALFALVSFLPEISMSTFFYKSCSDDGSGCSHENMFQFFIAWVTETLCIVIEPNTLEELVICCALNYFGTLFMVYCLARMIAVTYLNKRNSTDFQFFVSKIRRHFELRQIKPDLMSRLTLFLNCQWKKNYGMDIMNLISLKNEPLDIFNKIHGEHASQLIENSRAFKNADPRIIKELVNKSKFMLMPKGAPIIVFGVHNQFVTWLSRGFVRTEYYNENSELQEYVHPPGEMLSVSSVFFGKEAYRTYVAFTDCEILVVSLHDFNNVIKRYMKELLSIRYTVQEFEPRFTTIFGNHSTKYLVYQKNLLDRIRHFADCVIGNTYEHHKKWSMFRIYNNLWINPEFKYVYYWMVIRCFTVIVSIISSSLQAGGGANYRFILFVVCKVCDAFTFMDIFLKFFLAYYNEKGILIVSPWKCWLHYLSRGFIIDFLGFLPWYEIIKRLPRGTVPETQALIVNAMFKFLHVYLVTGLFDYLSDCPYVNGLFFQIMKWQTFFTLLTLCATPYFMSKCLDIQWDENMNLISVERLPKCWYYQNLLTNKTSDSDELFIIFAESLSLSQSGVMAIKIQINTEDWIFICILLSIRIIYWCVFCYCVSMLVLNLRGHRIFQHSVLQLANFLKSERVNQKLIKRAIAHFSYTWVRTKGLDIESLVNKQTGLILKQDMAYYLFKETLEAADSSLQGGGIFQKRLATVGNSIYFLPGYDIMRQMDLSPWLYIIHTGKVAISRDGVTIATLSKGSMFGQFDSEGLRPVKVTATTLERSDLVKIDVLKFQDILNEDIKKNIAENVESEFDYIKPKIEVAESHYSSVDYLLRGRISYMFPWSKEVIKVTSNSKMYKWLFLVWVFGPFTAASLSLIVGAIPLEDQIIVYKILMFLDLLHWFQFFSEFFIIEYAKINGVLVQRPRHWGNLKYFNVYMDLFTLITPCCTVITGEWLYQLARLLRIKLTIQFYLQFCRTFKSTYAPAFINLVLVVFFLHSLACGWIYVACRDDSLPYFVSSNLPPAVNNSLYNIDWQPGHVVSQHCVTITKSYKINNTVAFSFLKTKSWKADYIISFTYILLHFTKTNMNSLIALTINQIYYKIVSCFALYVITLWVTSLAISSVYGYYRDMYLYQYQVINLISFLENTGLCPTLAANVKAYCGQLWNRHRGNWFPRLMHQSPQCLKEDLFYDLYSHHLNSVPLFRHLPEYFTRQMVARLNRIVMFPGKCIVKQGDVFACMYFIHEGEVEKWHTDSKGDEKLLSLMTTNGHFGLISGLFPKAPYQFSYISRTVVDLVYLRISDWNELLTRYPDVNHDLYISAKQLKKEVGCMPIV